MAHSSPLLCIALPFVVREYSHISTGTNTCVENAVHASHTLVPCNASGGQPFKLSALATTAALPTFSHHFLFPQSVLFATRVASPALSALIFPAHSVPSVCTLCSCLSSSTCYPLCSPPGPSVTCCYCLLPPPAQCVASVSERASARLWFSRFT